MNIRNNFLLAGLLLVSGAMLVDVRLAFANWQQKAEKEVAASKDKNVVEATVTTASDKLFDEKHQFKAGDKIIIRLLLANKTAETVEVIRASEYDQVRFQLFRGDKLIPYKKGLSDVLRAKDKENSPSPGSIALLVINPGESVIAGFFDLSRWYEPLEPGEYKIRLQRRFEHEKKGLSPVESNEAIFEVGY